MTSKNSSRHAVAHRPWRHDYSPIFTDISPTLYRSPIRAIMSMGYVYRVDD